MDMTPESYRNTDSNQSELEFSLCNNFNNTPQQSTSTPLTQFSNNASRKRKIDCNIRKLTDVYETSPESPSLPQFSSTFNESLAQQFEHINIHQPNFYVDTLDKSEEQPRKQFKINHEDYCNLKSIQPVQNVTTPDKRSEELRRNTFVQQSPLKEAQCILYPSLKPIRKPTSPKKFKDLWHNSPAKKCLFNTGKDTPINKILSNDTIMRNIFKYLSNGDLFRVSLVSKSMYQALRNSSRAHSRFLDYRGTFRVNKENYRITPPSSPEKDAEVECDNVVFQKFFGIASSLTNNQTLTKCPICLEPSIVENNLGQCQSIKCGYKYCLLCNSFAYKAEEFHDKCNNSQLLNRTRNSLMDMSNSDYFSFSEPFSESTSSFFNNSPISNSRYDSSGYHSGHDVANSSTNNNNSMSVKRNLTKCFGSPLDKPKILSTNNRMVRNKSKTERRSSLVPVIKGNATKKPDIVPEPSSPPRNTVLAGSKESKRNLKRLTR